MAITVYKTFIPGEVLTASDLNASFTQIINNAADLVSPFTKNIAAGGFKITGLGVGSADGDSVRFEQLPFNVCNFRLTLTTAVPVTTSDVTAATTLYCAPYNGNAIGLYDGTNWHVRTSAEFSLALGTLSSAKPYDVFCYDSGGTPTLEFLAWTDSTTRATSLTTQNGVLVKTGALTRRYLGTFYTTSTTTTEDSFAKRFVWNYHNRTLRPMRVTEATDTWTYTTDTIRQARASTANQLDFVVGVSEDAVTAQLVAQASNATPALFNVGIGLDTTTAYTTGCLTVESDQGSGINILTASLKVFPGAGRHFLSWNETSNAVGTTTWVGDAGVPSKYQSGIHGEVWA